MTPPLRSGLPAAALLALCLAAPAASAAEQASAYSKHDFSRCAAKTSPEPGVVEIRRCQGYAGMPVVWSGEPDSSSVSFGSASDEKAIPGLDTFYEPRGIIEWRGPKHDGRLRPAAAILRYDTGPSVGSLKASRLVVYRLTPEGGSCIMAVIAGATPSANAAARAMVDRSAPDFVCGRSRILRTS